MPLSLDTESTSSTSASLFEGLVSDGSTTSRGTSEATLRVRSALGNYLRSLQPSDDDPNRGLFATLEKVWSGRLVFDRSQDQVVIGVTRYDWHKRMALLRAWKGNTEEGEASRIGQPALQLAEKLAAYFEARQLMLFGQILVKPVLSPLATGGVHLEFNLRTAVVHHLEIEIAPTAEPPYPLLRTIERKGGEIRESFELPRANEVELWALLEAFLATCQRVGSW